MLLLIALIISSCNEKADESVYDTPEKIILTGKVTNAPDSLRRITFLIHRMGFSQEELETELDSAGNFSTYFTSYIPVDFYVFYRGQVSMIAFPGDSIYFEFDGSKEEVTEILNTTVYSGDHAKLNTEIIGFQKIFRKDIYKHMELLDKAYDREPAEYLAFSDSMYTVKMHLYDSFVSRYNPGQEAKNWAKTFLTNGYLGRMNWYPSAYRMNNPGKKLKLPESYYGFLTDKGFKPDSVLYSASAIGNYIQSYQLHLGKVAQERTKTDFSPQELKSNPFLFDSVMFKVAMDTLGQGLLLETYLTRQMNGYLESMDLKGFEHFKGFAEQNIHHTFLKEPLFTAYEDLKNIKNKPPVKYEKKLEAIGSFFIEGLTDKHRGKITYIDIWATWCGPCRDEFKYSAELHEKYSADVEFIYICIDSYEEAYKNALKKYQLKGTHYFLDFEQSKALRKQINANGVPYYILIDDLGKVVGRGFEYRPSEKITQTTIEGLVKEKP